jgi:hypothetical protein
MTGSLPPDAGLLREVADRSVDLGEPVGVVVGPACCSSGAIESGSFGATMSVSTFRWMYERTMSAWAATSACAAPRWADLVGRSAQGVDA